MGTLCWTDVDGARQLVKVLSETKHGYKVSPVIIGGQGDPFSRKAEQLYCAGSEAEAYE